MRRRAAERATDVADALLTWLDERQGAPKPMPQRRLAASGETAPSGNVVSNDKPVRRVEDDALPAVAPAHTDWLWHHLQVDGPAAALDTFRAAAAGAGIIPWHLDLDRVEEDAFLRLAAPRGHARTLSLDGARLIAAELREAVGRRHALAIARVGRSRACAFDLHALVPVPNDILLLGPDHPAALRWLWMHWGTIDALRHVAPTPAPNGIDTATAACTFAVGFWSADCTPWRALTTVQARFPALRFVIEPRYATK